MKWKDLIEKYLENRKQVWSETTYKSERARLLKYSDLLDLSDMEFFKRLRDNEVAPYTVKTVFIRLSNFVQWGIDNEYLSGPNKFKQFYSKNMQVFRHAYSPARLSVSYEEALYKCYQLPSSDSIEHATYLLKTGIRLDESYNLVKGAPGIIEVVGKGGKKRRVYAKELPKALVPKSTLQKHLKDVGLSPHQLRKLFATHLVKNTGIKAHELCMIMGWSSIETALKYLQSRSEGALQELIDGTL